MMRDAVRLTAPVRESLNVAHRMYLPLGTRRLITVTDWPVPLTRVTGRKVCSVLAVAVGRVFSRTIAFPEA